MTVDDATDAGSGPAYLGRGRQVVIQVQRLVHAPIAPGDAADFLLDFTTTAIWDPHTAECFRVDRGPIGTGAHYQNSQRIAGRESRFHYTVTDFEPGHRVRLVGTSNSVNAQDTIIIDPDGRGTRITYVARLSFTGGLRYAEPLLRIVMNRIADDGANGMRRALSAIGHKPA